MFARHSPKIPVFTNTSLFDSVRLFPSVNLERLKDYDFEKNRPRGFALVLGALMFITSFRAHEFLIFIIPTTFAGGVGYFLGYAAQKLKKRIYRYPVYVLLTAPLIILFLYLIVYTNTSCAGYFPYEATNTFTGLDKRFIGGCGPYGEHPWYYENPSRLY